MQETKFLLILLGHYVYTYLMVLILVNLQNQSKPPIRYKVFVVWVMLTTLYWPVVWSIHFDEDLSNQNTPDND